MKLFLFLLLTIVLMPLDVQAQTAAVSITGKVTDCKTHDAIEGATLRLFGDDGSVTDIKSDKQGVYSFDNTKVKSGRKYILTILSSEDNKYIGSAETTRIEPSTKNKHFNYNLCLEPSKGCTIGQDLKKE